MHIRVLIFDFRDRGLEAYVQFVSVLFCLNFNNSVSITYADIQPTPSH